MSGGSASPAFLGTLDRVSVAHQVSKVSSLWSIEQCMVIMRSEG